MEKEVSPTLKKGGHDMKTFKCTRLRLCNYLMDREFFPYRVEPDPGNPRYRIYLFEETPALTAAVVRYFSTDCYTAQKTLHGGMNYEEHTSTNHGTDPSNPDHPANSTDAV